MVITRRLILYLFFIAIGFLICFALIYKSLENSRVYNAYFSSFMPTYENQNGTICSVNKPFTKIEEIGYIAMDAASYWYIRNNFYTIDPNNIETNYTFGFFPLFPVLWKFFSGQGIIIINYFLHFIAIVILAFTFCRKKIVFAIITVLALPTLSVFLLPYTESLFMFSISVALLGYTKENKYLYTIGLILASATRPIFLLFLFALIATEVYQYLRNKKINYKHLLFTSAIVISVTLLVSLFQYSYHKSSLFTFMSVQRHWGTYFRIPNKISDWSWEGYGMNVWALLFCFIFGIASLISALFKKLKTESGFEYWYYFSWIYLIAVCGYVLFFQGGCLHSLYRYTLCCPFFYVIIFNHINSMERLPIGGALILFISFVIVCDLFFHAVEYPAKGGFDRTGFILLTINLLFFILSAKVSDRIKYFSYIPLIIAGIIWNCYLYNMFFSKAWVFL